MRIVVAIYEPAFWTLPATEITRLERALPDDEVVVVRSAGEQGDAMREADVLFGTRLTTADDLRRATRLRWVHSSAVGIGGMLFPEFVASSILLSNSRGLHAAPIAEHAIALMLALRRQIPLAVRRQIDREWAQEEIYALPVPPLDGACLAVIGLGAIGARVARLASALGMRVVGVRKRVWASRPEGVADVLPADRLHDALSQADVVVLALPHTLETGHLIGDAELAAMKPTSLLINVARGKLIDDDALIAALRSRRIAGAGLDAFAREPLPADHPYWTVPNLLLTPHTAAFGGDYWQPAVDLFLDNLSRFREGLPLVNLIDKARGY